MKTVELDDGRRLVVQYEGARYGWCCYVPGGTGRPTWAQSPADAIVEHLGFSPARIPTWVHELSERRLRELDAAPRYSCRCCGHLTVLNPGHYEICEVCRWEDDPAVDWNGPDAHSGPNYMSLNEGRANFAAFGTSAKGRKTSATRSTRAEPGDPRPDV